MGMVNVQALCTSKEALRAREALARRFEANTAQEQALWKAFDQNLVTVLSAEDESKVRNWVDDEVNIGVGTHTYIANEIRSGRMNPDEILERACTGVEETAATQAIENARNQGEAKRPVQEPAAPADASKTRKSVSSAGIAIARPTGPQPSLIALPKPPTYSQCEAWAINNVGTIVGTCWNGKDRSHTIPMRWQQGVAEVLSGPLMSEGATEGDLPAVEGMAVAINDAGEIVGSLLVGRNPHHQGMRAAIWEGSYWRDLGLPKDAENISARGINARGDVVGSASNHAAILWRAENAFEVLPNPKDGWHCEGIGINNQGQAVGMCNDQSSLTEVAAVLWQNHTAVVLANPCGTGEGLWSWARTITDSGVIGGRAGSCAMVWHASTPDKGTVVADDGVVNSINKRGEMVGYVGGLNGTSTNRPPERPIKWVNEAAPPVDVSSNTAKEGHIRAINDRGVFVGAYTSATGESLAFVSQ